MTELRQRQPRVHENKYLAWLRLQPCACGCGKPPPSDAAHLRAGSLKYGKEFTGWGKPHDRWAMPLNRSCHMRQHAFGSEVEWWTAHGVPDPFGRSMRYYAAYTAEAFAEANRKATGKRSASKPRKPKVRAKARQRPPQRAKIAKRANPWPKRKLSNRKKP